jgi:hypothetical protein
MGGLAQGRSIEDRARRFDAEYSSDRQSPASITDQLRKCRESAASEGWVLQERHETGSICTGAGQCLIGVDVFVMQASSREPRPFDVLLIDDTSRCLEIAPRVRRHTTSSATSEYGLYRFHRALIPKAIKPRFWSRFTSWSTRLHQGGRGENPSRS